MLNSYYHVLGHVVAATFATRESGDLVAALAKGGFAKERIAEGEKLWHEGEELVRQKIDLVSEDRIREHSVHAATAELEMWLQTAVFQTKKVVEEESVLELLLADKLHAHEHTLTAIAKSLRVLTMLRCDDRISGRLGGERRVRQILNRGHALLKRLYTATDIRLAAQGREAELEIFARLASHQAKMEAWMAALHAATAAVAQKDLRLLGRLGYAPNDYGIPVGGTSYAVVLHENGQTEAPDPTYVTDCPGWSSGRQGRNSENLGKGWIAPTFEG